jgi:hypothetical protein
MVSIKTPTLGTRFLRYLSAGPWAGPIACFITACMYIYFKIIERIWPVESIEECPDIFLKNSHSSNAAISTASSIRPIKNDSK